MIYSSYGLGVALSKFFLPNFLSAGPDDPAPEPDPLGLHTLSTITSAFGTARTGSGVCGYKSVGYGSSSGHDCI